MTTTTLNHEPRTSNIPLLREAVEWAEGQAKLPPSQCQWDQGEWVSRDAECGTAYCLAGYIGQRLNPQFRFSDTALIDNKHVFVGDFAEDALGLSAHDANLLFDGANSIEDVRRVAEYLAGMPL